MTYRHRRRVRNCLPAKRRALWFEHLEDRRLLVGEDVFEPNDSKAEVDAGVAGGVNSPNLGIISANRIIPALGLMDTADWFRVETSDYGTSHDFAQIDFVHSNGDLILELYAANGTTRIARSDSSWTNQNRELVSFAQQPPGIYYLKITGASGAFNNDYSLTIDPPGNSVDDAYESNDTTVAVDARPAGGVDSPNLGTITSTTTVSNLRLEDEVDWYRVVTSDYGTSHDTAQLSFTHANGDLVLGLYASDGVTLLASSNSSWTNNNFEEVSFATRAPGTYYLKVTGSQGAANASYSLTIDPPGNSVDDAYESNDTTVAVDARPAGGPNSPNLGTITSTTTISDLRLEDEVDWYRVVTSDYGTSHDTARLSFTHADGDLVLGLYASDGVTLLDYSNNSWTNNHFEEVSFATRAPGTYYLKVTGYQGAANASYSLTIDPPGNSTDDGYEPNDSTVAISEQPPGVLLSSNLGVLSETQTITGLRLEDQVDWYRVDTTDYGTSRDFARIDFSHASGDLILELYAANGTTQLDYANSSWTNSNLEVVSFAQQPPGTYFLKVTGYQGDANASYSLTIDPPGNTPDDLFEVNDSPADVLNHTPGGAYSSNLGLLSGVRTVANLKLEDQVDWYRFELGDFPIADNLARIDFSHASGDLVLELYSVDQTTRLAYANSSWTNNNFELISLAGRTGGEFWLKVSGNGGAANAEYTLTINAPVLPPPRADLAVLPDRFFASPTWVAPGGTLQTTLEIINRGNAASGNVRLAAYLSSDSALTTGDRLLWQTTVSLNAGEHDVLSNVPLTIPADVTLGSYFVGFLIDDEAAVSEPNEFNNAVTTPLTVSAGTAGLGQIRGQVYDDADADGIKDTGEAGILGRTLFLDLNQSGQLDVGEPTTTSDASGNYTFNNVPPGRYRVETIAPVGWKSLWPPSTGGDLVYLHGSSKLATVNLTSGEVKIVGSTGTSFGDIAFDPRGNLFGVTYSGLYKINPLTGQTTFVGSHSAFGTNALTFDSDGTLYAMAGSQLFVINPATGQSTLRGSAGVTSDGDLAFFQGRLYLTTSNKRLYEVDELTGTGTDLGLHNMSGLFGLVTTNTGELVAFSNQKDYMTLETTGPVARYRGSFAGLGTFSLNGAARFGEAGGPMDGAYVIDVTSGQVVSNLNFSQVRLGSVSGIVYNDHDLNGIRGTLEPPLSSWTVFADLNGDGARQLEEPAGTTAGDGRYFLAGLLPGAYTIRLVVPSGWSATAPLNARHTVNVSGATLNAIADFGAAQPRAPRIVDAWPAPGVQIDSGVSELRFQFSNAMDSGTLWTGAFLLTAAGGDGTFGTGNERQLRGADLAWNAATKTATVQFNDPLPRDLYQITVLDVLTDIYGSALDGEWRGVLPSGDGAEFGQYVATFEVTNAPPVAGNLQATARQGMPLTLALSAVDPDGEAVTYRIITPPAHGVLVATGSPAEFIYTPNAAYLGSDSFVFAASDGRAESEPATFHLRVTPSPSNLVPTSLSWNVGTSIFPGGGLELFWTGTNLGPAATSEFFAADWADYVYLSDDTLLDGSDRRLGTFNVDVPAVGPGGSYVGRGAITLPNNLVERTGDYYFILRVDGSSRQLDADIGNNQLVVPFQLTAGVQLLNLRADSLFGIGQEIALQWRDYSADPSATITLALDLDNSPVNGVGHTVLDSGLAAAADGANDQHVPLIPQLTPGQYFVWAKLTDSAGDHFSQVIPITVTEAAYRDVSFQSEPVGGGSYEVLNVEWGRIGNEIVYRVLTNYNPKTTGGGDLYINVGGDYLRGNGELVGIAVNDRTTTSGLPVRAGRLYTGAAFHGGTSRRQHPTFIRSYAQEITGRSSLQVRELGSSSPRYLISGSFYLNDLGADANDPLQVGWAMYCGNDFGHAENEEPRPDLVGTEMNRELNPDERHIRWGDSLIVNVEITNRGTADAPASSSVVYLSTDNHFSEPDLSVGSISVPALAAGESWSGQITIPLPASAPAGFGEEGTFYVGMIADHPQAIEEQDEQNNGHQGEGEDWLTLRIGGSPQYVYVLTHGFNPDVFNVNGPTEADWAAFRYTWQTTYPDVIRGMVAGTDLADEVTVYSSAWDSTSGWRGAFISAAAGIVLSAFPVTRPLARLAFRQIGTYMLEAQRLAEDAARTIVQNVTTLPGYLDDPGAGQIIHLVGHSRGAAVNARVNQLLVGMGYSIDQYTALDGYSTDWPKIYGLLGDIPISTRLVQANHKINYRVEQGLSQAAGGMLDQLISNKLESLLGWPVDIHLSEDLLSLFDVRAPERPGFVNTTIIGDAASGPSHHMNVSPIYFGSRFRPEGQDYVMDSTLGRAAIAAGAAQGGGSLLPDQTQSTGAGIQAAIYPNVVLPASDLHTFYDGTIDDLGATWREVLALDPQLTFSEEFLNQWLALARNPAQLLSSAWNTSGNVEFALTGDQTSLELIQTTDTSLGQYLVLPGGVSQLQFRLDVLAAGTSDLLEVRFGNELLTHIDLTQPNVSQQQSISLAGRSGQTGHMTFRLVGPTGEPSRIRLDDFAVIAPLALTGLRPDTSVTSDTTLNLTAFGATDAAAVDFYRETNGLEGLQTGVGGDTLLTTDSTSGDGWQSTIDIQNFAAGMQLLYAVARDGSGLHGTAVTSTTVSVAERPTLNLSFDVSSVHENSGQIVGTVTRTNDDIAQAVTVSLSGVDSDQAAFPATVVIPANETSVTFILVGVNDAVVDGDQVVQITAASSGFDGAAGFITVIDDDSLFPLHNNTDAYDVENDGDNDVQDAIAVIRWLRRQKSGQMLPSVGPPFVDVRADNVVNIQDALDVIRQLRRQLPGAGEGESALSLATAETIVHPEESFENAISAIAFDVAWSTKNQGENNFPM